MTLKVLLVIASLTAPAVAFADSPQDTLDKLSTALQKGDAQGALELFDPQIPFFSEIKGNIEAWSKLPNTNCSIAIKSTKQAQDSVTFETHWSLQTYSVQNGPLLDRSGPVTIALRQIDDNWIIIALSPAAILAPPDASVFSLIAKLAADLNDKNESGALSAFDSSIKKYGEIDNDIDALVTQNDVLCGIDIISDRQMGEIHQLDLDWFFQLKSRADGGPSQDRRQRVQVELKKSGRKWKILSMEPLSILSPEIIR